VITRTKPRKNGTVHLTFALPLDTPEGPVSVVGDFNDWQPGVHELRPSDIDGDGNGHRVATVSVPTGTTLRFRYLAAGGVWFDDEAADAHDEHGSLLTV